MVAGTPSRHVRWRQLALGGLLVALAGAPLATAAWTQAGGDPARSFASLDGGPAHDEVALHLDLPAARVAGRPLLIQGGAVHLLLDEPAPVPRAPAASAIWRADLATGELAKIAVIPSAATGWAMDAERYYVARAGAIEAYAHDGSVAWTWTFSSVVPRPEATGGCVDPVIAYGTLFTSCFYEPAPWTPVALATYTSFIEALDATTGEEKWWRLQGDDNNGYATGVLAAGGQFVTTEIRQSGDYHAHVMGWDVESGECLWFIRHHWRRSVDQADVPGSIAALSRSATMSVAVLGSDREIIIKFGDLRGYAPPPGDQACDSADLAEEWGAAPVGMVLGRSSLAQAQGRVYVGEGGALASVGLDPAHEVRDFSNTSNGQEWSPGGILLAGERVYAFSHDPATSSGVPRGELRAFDANGTILWTRETWRSPADPPALGAGVLAYTTQSAFEVNVITRNGSRLMVLGRTPASIQPAVAWPDAYPAVGALVTIDLTGTQPGLLSDATDVRVDWGDGESSQERLAAQAVYEHAYTTSGDKLVRVTLANDAGQTAIEETLLHVGAAPPASVGFIGAQFAGGNQERTFFLLGLLVTAGVGGFSLARVQRRRRRLARELAAIDQAYRLTHARPSDCDAALGERRAHVRGLLLDGQIDEAQYGVLDKRIEELHRQVRLDTIDEQMGFLPISMARALKTLLQDGRIERWERAHFLDLLEGDMHLTLDQKARVRKLIDAWFERDDRAALPETQIERV